MSDVIRLSGDQARGAIPWIDLRGFPMRRFVQGGLGQGRRVKMQPAKRGLGLAPELDRAGRRDHVGDRRRRTAGGGRATGSTMFALFPVTADRYAVESIEALGEMRTGAHDPRFP